MDAFVKAANASCDANFSEIAEMTVAEQPHFSLRQILARGRKGWRQLKSIEPPKGLTRDFQRFLNLLNQRYETAKLLVESARISSAHLNQITSNYNRQTMRVNRLARRLRLVRCPSI
jgi:hypothetical protein